ncbi:linear amide C-N hydrolase [Micromonospora sp. WMMD1128]|uniref:linear amide C-N hydrolase n=1 Tax=Micromonospora sp. WMMD1128 TaxID=3015150 RepID=UPI00248B58EF|nr:linear amide C-N hydrolase [Micromonospora sp. WMMD1128]WBB76321.1 linear amide C-N hydrolase [Micromonospora sp. WMMD1128]
MRRTVVATVLALLLVGTGCGEGRAPVAPVAAGTATASRQDPGQVERTLASLRKVDDLPLYEMTYVGDYDPTAGVAGADPPSPFGCSLFAALGDRDRPLFARNFDWEPNPALVLRTDPPDGYASLSLVDISYLGVTADPAGDRRLLDAPLLPFDGMNERGLAVGLAADDGARAEPVSGRPTVGSVRILRLVLDSAATVDEAVTVFERYNLDFDGGPPLHYLLADATGASAVVEFVDGKLTVDRRRGPWQALTNVPAAGVPDRDLRRDHRYGVLAKELDRVGGVLDAPGALRLLDGVRQAHTRWSVTYALRGGEVRVVTAGGGTRDYRLSMS